MCGLGELDSVRVTKLEVALGILINKTVAYLDKKINVNAPFCAFSRQIYVHVMA